MSRFHFIFMLTRNDRTVADASKHIEAAIEAGVLHIGFKDVGLPTEALADLTRQIRVGGGEVYLEVVSLDRESELRSVGAAIDLGVDYLLGGVHVEEAVERLIGAGIRYYPFPGRVVGHPSILEGTQEEIVESARDIARHPGVAGLDLLAWRSRADVPALIEAVCSAVSKPVIVAGSISDPDQIRLARQSGAAGFTIGTAALDGRFPAAGPALRDQLAAILASYSD